MRLLVSNRHRWERPIPMAARSGSDLFAAMPELACGGYRNLRDPPSDNARLCRDYCDRLWQRFEPYADAGFVGDFPVHLHQRFWEMYVAVTMLDAGHAITAPKP